MENLTSAAPAATAGAPASLDTAAGDASVSAELDSLFTEESAGADSTDTTPIDEPAEPVVTKTEPLVETKAPPAETQPKAEEAAVVDPLADTGDPLSDDGFKYERNGKQFVRYPAARATELHTGFVASRQLAEQMTGQPGPLTPELVKRAMGDQNVVDSLIRDTRSTDPAKQADAFGYMFHLAVDGYERGFTSHNPAETMADAFLNAAHKMAPGVVTQLEQRFQQSTIDSLYQKAMELGHEKDQPGYRMFSTAQNLDQALNGTFRDRKDIKPVDKVALREAELKKREDAIKQRDQATATQQRQKWLDTAITDKNGAMDAEIDRILDSVVSLKGDTKEAKEERQNLVLRFRKEIKDAINADETFVARMKDVLRSADVAGSDAIRDQFRKQFISSNGARAAQILRKVAPGILEAIATRRKATSDAKHQQLQKTQTTRALPNGEGAAASPRAASNGQFRTQADHLKEVDEMFAGV